MHPAAPPDPGRRRVLQALGATSLLPLHAGCRRDADGTTVVDISAIDETPVRGIARPRSTDEVASLLRDSDAPVSIGGARCSMGGQTASAGSLHLDMRGLKAIRIDAGAMRARVHIIRHAVRCTSPNAAASTGSASPMSSTLAVGAMNFSASVPWRCSPIMRRSGGAGARSGAGASSCGIAALSATRLPIHAESVSCPTASTMPTPSEPLMRG